MDASCQLPQLLDGDLELARGIIGGRDRLGRRRSASVASTILARELRSSDSAARCSVKSRMMAVTSSGPLGAILASNYRRPLGRSNVKS